MKDDDDDIFIGLMVFIYILVSGVLFNINWALPDMVNAEAYQEAIQLCHKHEGLNFIELDIKLHDVHCNDGSVFPDAIKKEG